MGIRVRYRERKKVRIMRLEGPLFDLKVLKLIHEGYVLLNGKIMCSWMHLC